jgi:hypothetical protein
VRLYKDDSLSKRQKRLQKIRQQPSNVSFETLRQVLEDYGLWLDRITGSHYVFGYNLGGQEMTLVIPFKKRVKPVYVKNALQLIAQIIEEQGEDETED